MTWETCTLRNWLNTDFYVTAFTGTEQKYVAETYVINDDSYYETEGGNNTYDKIFLLSIDEVTTYFVSAPEEYDPERRAQVTGYAEAQGGWASTDSEYYGNGWWWLRSPGYHSGNAAYVRGFGDVYSLGDYVDVKINVVRPALWIKVE